MSVINELANRLQNVANSPVVAKLPDSSRDDFAKISVSFSKVVDCIDLINTPMPEPLKASDIAMYQADIQKHLENISNILVKLEKMIAQHQ